MNGGIAIVFALALFAPVGAAAPVPAPARAERVAEVVSEAAAAAEAGDRARLRGALDRLDRLGARAEGDMVQTVAQWRAAAGGAPPALRGRVLGPAVRRGVIAPASEFLIQQLFLGGRPAAVAVSASPAAPLTVSVTDADRVEACAAPRAGCRWVPFFTQRYTIRVRNAGPRVATMYLVVD